MQKYLIAGILLLSGASAFAQNSPPAADTKPSTPGVTTSKTPTADSPAAGSNSFTMAQAQSRIAAAGYTDVTGLAKDDKGVWRGTATKNGTSVPVSLDYQGNVLPK
jgi:hypothetical protein